MNAKPFTLSIVVAAVIGAVSLVSAQIDRQEMFAAEHPAPMQAAARDPSAPLATASPLDIDPRRMEAPPAESQADARLDAQGDVHTQAASTDELPARAVKVSSAS